MRDRKQHGIFALSRRQLIGLGLGATAMAVTAACAPSPAPSAPGAPAASGNAKPIAKKMADTIVFAHSGIAPTFDPAYALSNSGFMMARQVYDALVTFDEQSKIIPQLAASWKRIDPLTMEFKLRDDVKFQNGEDFTAESVKFTVNRLMTSKNANHSGTKNRLAPLSPEVEIVNSNTVRLKTTAPDPILLNKLVSLFLLPPKFGQQAGDDGIAKQGIGTGPYKGIEVVPSQRISLEAWDRSWRGAPKVKQAKILQFNENAAMIAALKSGDVDIIFRLEPDEAEGVKGAFNIVTNSGGSATAPAIFQQFGPAFKDKRVRQAINLAINREEFVQKLLGGYATVLQGQLIEKGMLGFDDRLKPPPYDPEKARALLREAGQSNLSLTWGTSVSTRPITEGAVGYLQAVGITTKINVYEAAVNTRNIQQKSPDPVYSLNRDFFHVRDFDVHGAALTVQEQRHFDNEEFHSLYQRARQEIDEEKRGNLIKQLSELLLNEYGVVFLFVRQIITPFTKKIAKLPTHFDTAYYLWEVEKEA